MSDAGPRVVLRFFLVIAGALVGGLSAACDDYDDTELRNEIAQLQTTVSRSPTPTEPLPAEPDRVVGVGYSCMTQSVGPGDTAGNRDPASGRICTIGFSEGYVDVSVQGHRWPFRNRACWSQMWLCQ